MEVGPVESPGGTGGGGEGSFLLGGATSVIGLIGGGIGRRLRRREPRSGGPSVGGPISQILRSSSPLSDSDGGG